MIYISLIQLGKMPENVLKDGEKERSSNSSMQKVGCSYVYHTERSSPMVLKLSNSQFSPIDWIKITFYLL